MKSRFEFIDESLTLFVFWDDLGVRHYKCPYQNISCNTNCSLMNIRLIENDEYVVDLCGGRTVGNLKIDHNIKKELGLL